MHLKSLRRRRGTCLVGIPRLALSLLALLVGPGTAVSADASSARPPATTAPAAKTGPFDEKADARKDIAAALTQAKTDGKFVLLDFGANWCPDCLMLARLFETNAVKPFLAANFHLVKIDVGRNDKNQDLCAEYGKPTGKGIPAVVVLDPEGRVVASTAGGELANARTAKAPEILDYLKRWRAAGPKP